MPGTCLIGPVDLGSMLPQMLPRLWKFAHRLSDDAHNAEDLVQCACLRALERAHQLQPDTAPLNWMFSILYSIWISDVHARNVHHCSRLDWEDAFMETVPNPAASNPQTAVTNAQITSAVLRLPEAQRVAMLLVAVEGLTYREAADVLGVPIGTVMSRLSRARQAIGAQFETGKHQGMSRST